ncbi:MAG: thiamine-phosphate kinase [Candidatus Binatia bacterium]
MRRRLRDVGEHGWLRALLPRLNRGPRDPRVLIGPGDDAAVLRWGRGPIVLTTDTLVEGGHFRRGWLSPAALGRRAYGVNASDLAAMGATPVAALLALECPPDLPVRTIDGLVAGLVSAARRHGARLVGGNVAAGPHLAITVTLVGTTQGPLVRRAGARPGDLLCVSGRLGAVGYAVRERLAGRPARIPDPPDRVRLATALAPLAHAMIDVSDGLVQDLGHLCRASSVGAEVELARLPVAPSCRRAFGDHAAIFAATAGEDHELLFAAPPRAAATLARLAARTGCPITPIGRCVAGRAVVRLQDARGCRVRTPNGGFDHFVRPALYEQ